MVNSGRLSLPAVYDSVLSTPDATPFGGAAKLGAPLPDAPLRRADGTAAYLLENLRDGFELICVKGAAEAGDHEDATGLMPAGVRRTVIGEDFFDHTGIFAQRFDATPGAAYLVRPDQHLCARWRRFDAARVAAAHARALGR
jgi:3-(3-hydroxy-phenyl)propionate hydroxylase